MKGDKGKCLSKNKVSHLQRSAAKLAVYSEFAGTLLGFDDYVSTSLLLVVCFTRNRLTYSLLRYGAGGCDRVVGSSLCRASDSL